MLCISAVCTRWMLKKIICSTVDDQTGDNILKPPIPATNPLWCHNVVMAVPQETSEDWHICSQNIVPLQHLSRRGAI